MNILITGANGFVGKNLVQSLQAIRNGSDKTRKIIIDNIFLFDIDDSLDDLENYIKESNYIINLAGVNRPLSADEFYKGNKGFIEILCSYLKKYKNDCPIVASSSIQVGNENDYAKSKEEGEKFLKDFSKENGNPIFIYRFTNLFGKWCQPNYNSVTATWCYNIANNIDIEISNPDIILPLCYIDDVVDEVLSCIEGNACFNGEFYEVKPIHEISLGELSKILLSFKKSRMDFSITNQSQPLIKKLYATYLSYLSENDFRYPLKMNIDNRGSFTEFLKTSEYGQISINISKVGIVKGNHWHHTKNEKFLVVHGTGIIRFRKIGEDRVIEYIVSDKLLEVVDIPVGYTHNIENIGDTDMVTVMWANEQYDSNKPDTFFEEV